jgi:WbqC-like protein family
MIVSINQPAYLAWLGYFHRIAVSDIHIVLDHVQFEKNSFTNRNKIRTKDGSCWLTVPLKTGGRFGDLAITQIEIANERRWAEKHWSSIRLNYSKAKYFRQHADFFEASFSRSWLCLNSLLREITAYLLDAFGIRTRILFSSELEPSARKSELVLQLCSKVGATSYLSGSLGRNYLDEGAFQRAGIAVAYQDFRHPIYTQVYAGFEPFMSAVDLLFNCGPDSLDILMRGQTQTEASVHRSLANPKHWNA